MPRQDAEKTQTPPDAPEGHNAEFCSIVQGYQEQLRGADEEQAALLLGELAALVGEEAQKREGTPQGESLAIGAAELRSIRWHRFGTR